MVQSSRVESVERQWQDKDKVCVQNTKKYTMESCTLYFFTPQNSSFSFFRQHQPGKPVTVSPSPKVQCSLPEGFLPEGLSTKGITTNDTVLELFQHGCALFLLVAASTGPFDHSSNLPVLRSIGSPSQSAQLEAAQAILSFFSYCTSLPPSVLSAYTQFNKVTSKHRVAYSGTKTSPLAFRNPSFP